MTAPELRPRPTRSAAAAAPGAARSAAASEWRLVVGSKTDVGRARTRNEDSVYAEPAASPNAGEWGWFGAVADGLGGQPAGDIASRLAVQTARDSYYWGSPPDTADRLLAAVEYTNGAIYRAGRRSARRTGMATTITAAVIRDDRLVIAQVGDSRAYLLRDGDLRQLTTDHTWVQDSVDAGVLSPEEARTHPQRHVVTRALGQAEDVTVDVIAGPLRAGDVVILCSDGLHGLVDEADITRLAKGHPQFAAEALVATANERGGTDNISVVLARLVPILPPAPEATARSLSVGGIRPLILVGIATLAAVLTFWALLLLEAAIFGR